MRDHATLAARLGSLQGQAHVTEEAERGILKQANQQLEQLDRDIAAARPKALLSEEDGERYSALILQRGKTLQVIARAKQNLGLP